MFYAMASTNGFTIIHPFFTSTKKDMSQTTPNCADLDILILSHQATYFYYPSKLLRSAALPITGRYKGKNYSSDSLAPVKTIPT